MALVGEFRLRRFFDWIDKCVDINIRVFGIRNRCVNLNQNYLQLVAVNNFVNKSLGYLTLYTEQHRTIGERTRKRFEFRANQCTNDYVHDTANVALISAAQIVGFQHCVMTMQCDS